MAEYRSYRKNIYKITITNWEKYNKQLKKSHKAILLPTNFFYDAKIRILSPPATLLFLNLLTSAGELTHNCVTCDHQLLVMWCTGRGHVVHNYLSELESLQLVSVEICAAFKKEKKGNEYKEKGKERKLRKGTENYVVKDLNAESETKIPEVLVEEKVAHASPAANIGKNLVAVYCDLWKTRYGSNPPLRAQDTRSLKSIGEENGFDRTVELLEVFLRMNEDWFLKKRHDLATFANNLTAVAQYSKSGRVITKQDLNTFERKVSNQQTLDALRKGEI